MANEKGINTYELVQIVKPPSRFLTSNLLKSALNLDGGFSFGVQQQHNAIWIVSKR